MDNDENSQPPEKTAENVDLLSNFKAEMDRKLGNVTEQLARSNTAIQEQLKAVVDAFSSRMAPAPKADPETFYETDPVSYKERIKQEVLTEARQLQDQALKKQTALNSTVYQLSQEYPEIQSAGSEMQKAVLAAHNALPETLRDTPEGYELAVTRAASQLKVKRKSERSEAGSGDFSMGAGQGSKRKAKEESGITDEMLTFAQLLGRPVDDPEYRKRLENASKRKNWNKFE